MQIDSNKKVSFKKLHFAVVGATGAVGKTILAILSERGVPPQNVKAVASDRSHYLKVSYGEQTELSVQTLGAFSFQDIDVAFFAVDSDVAKIHAPRAAQEGALVIDKSSHFRLNSDVPLVIPEVNADACAKAEHSHIIANPNCSTIQLLTALGPIHAQNPIKRLVIATYQAVSGAGGQAMDILYNETKTVLMNQPSTQNTLFTKPIAFNVIPHIDSFTSDGDTKEELKLRFETQKILCPTIAVSATCVRVPVFIGHSMAVNVELTNAVDLAVIRSTLNAAQSIKLAPHFESYHTPVEAAQEDPVYVSRLRQDDSLQNGLNLWIVADNMRKGAALNGIQIAETVCKRFPNLIRRK